MTVFQTMLLAAAAATAITPHALANDLGITNADVWYMHTLPDASLPDRTFVCSNDLGGTVNVLVLPRLGLLTINGVKHPISWAGLFKTIPRSPSAMRNWDIVETEEPTDTNSGKLTPTEWVFMTQYAERGNWVLLNHGHPGYGCTQTAGSPGPYDKSHH